LHRKKKAEHKEETGKRGALAGFERDLLLQEISK